MTNKIAITAKQSQNAVEFMPMYITVKTAETLEDLYHEDRDALGTFKVEVPRHLSPAVAAAAALGAFHSTVPIKRLWNFEITVSDERSFEVQPDYEEDVYELAEQHGARFVD